MNKEKRTRIIIIALATLLALFLVGLFLFLGKSAGASSDSFINKVLEKTIFGGGSKSDLAINEKDNDNSYDKDYLTNGSLKKLTDGAVSRYSLSEEDKELISDMVKSYMELNGLVLTDYSLDSPDISTYLTSSEFTEFLDSYIESFINAKYSILNYITEDILEVEGAYDIDLIAAQVSAALINNTQFIEAVASATGLKGAKDTSLEALINDLKATVNTILSDLSAAIKDIEGIDKDLADYKVSNEKELIKLNNDLSDYKKENDKALKDLNDEITKMVNEIIGDGIKSGKWPKKDKKAQTISDSILNLYYSLGGADLILKQNLNEKDENGDDKYPTWAKRIEDVEKMLGIKYKATGEKDESASDSSGGVCSFKYTSPDISDPNMPGGLVEITPL